MLTRRELLCSAGVLIQSAQPRPPNVLFILADQWRAQTLPSAGDPDLRAPNLARLAEIGVTFSRAYTTNPVCSPARASIMTGRFPHSCKMPRNNLLLPLEERCLAEQYRRAGYATGYIGKWHLDGAEIPGFVPPGPRRRGFDYWAAFNRGHFYYDSTYFRDTPEPIRESGFEPDYQTRLAIDFIRTHKEKPFLLFLSWGPPHSPRRPPDRVKGLYEAGQFHLRPNVPASYASQARKGYLGYYGLCSALDENLGRLLRELEQNRLLADTIVVFTADHGDMLGSHGLENKGVPYEESARIPCLVSYPRRLKGGRTDDTLISNLDYMPTLLGMCGLDAPQGIQGQDLSELILNGAGRRPESVYVQGRLGTPGEWRMIVRGFDKLVVDAKFEPTHLFNLAEDPYEMTNQIDDRTQRRRIDELTAVLKSWSRRTGDRVPYPDTRRRP
jgi:arylsulfatase A-like enzyme